MLRSKREQAIRNSPGDVRFNDLDHLLRDYGLMLRNRGRSHHVYSHPLVPNIVNVPRHAAKVKPVYVRQAIDAVRAVPEADE